VDLRWPLGNSKTVGVCVRARACDLSSYVLCVYTVQHGDVLCIFIDHHPTTGGKVHFSAAI